MSGIDPQVTDVSNARAINIIQEIHREGKISDELAEA